MEKNVILKLIILISLSNFSYSEESQVHPNGYWIGKEIINEHKFDPFLARALVTFLKREKAYTVVDFGCGLGDYVKTLLICNFHCEGYDGNPDTYALTEGVATTLDLSEPFDLKKTFDWVISLEVGEHLPKRFESIFLENLDRHSSKGIILSWAIKGQGGFGHFNEQDSEYIKNLMKNLNYINDITAEQTLKQHSSLSWFKNTIMVFRKSI